MDWTGTNITDLDSNQIRPVVGFDGYFVSVEGHVYSARLRGKNCDLCSDRVERKLIPQTKKYGYQVLGLMVEGGRTYFLVHRLVLEAFVRQCPDGMECCHKDSNAKNNCVDRKKHCGNYALRGSKHPTSKLTEKNIFRIRRLLSMGKSKITQREIAAKFGVGAPTINKIKFNQRWSHC